MVKNDIREGNYDFVFPGSRSLVVRYSPRGVECEGKHYHRLGYYQFKGGCVVIRCTDSRSGNDCEVELDMMFNGRCYHRDYHNFEKILSYRSLIIMAGKFGREICSKYSPKSLKVASVYLLPNHTVITFGKNKEQIPELQGKYSSELIKKIRKHSTIDTKWVGWEFVLEQQK